MAIDTDLSTDLAKVRFIIGDTSGDFITDQTINALLTINSNNVNLTAIQALQAIVADLAKKVRQEVGDVQVWFHDQYEQYKDLLDKILKDPAYAVSPAVHFFGGTSKTEADRVNGNSDSRRIGITDRQLSNTNDCSTDLNNPFFLDCND